jgi:hypothetical protein
MADRNRDDGESFDFEPGQRNGSGEDAIPKKLSHRIRSSLRADLRPVRPLPAAWICFLGLFATLAIIAAALTSILGTSGVKLMNGGQLAGMSAIFTAGGALFAFLLTRQLAPTLPQPVGTSRTVLLFGFVALTGTILLFPWRETGTDWLSSWQCLIRVVSVALLTSVILAVPMRRAAMLSPTVKGATLGAAAGLTGIAVQQFGCMHMEASHLLLWHWSGIAIAAGAGAVIGRTRSRVSFRHE